MSCACVQVEFLETFMMDRRIFVDSASAGAIRIEAVWSIQILREVRTAIDVPLDIDATGLSTLSRRKESRDRCAERSVAPEP